MCLNLIFLQAMKKQVLALTLKQHVEVPYLLSIIVQAVFSMCSHCGQKAEKALQGIAVTRRKQKYQELEGALLI